MKKCIVSGSLFSLMTLVFLSAGCTNKEEKKEEKIEIVKNVTEGEESENIATLSIEGMTCEVGCAGFITKKLSKMDGVLSAEVVFEENKAKVKFDDAKISEKELIAEIQNLNEGQYKVTKVEIEKKVKKVVSETEAIQSTDTPSSGSSKTETKKFENVSHTINSIVFPNVLTLIQKMVLSER